ncbi:MAG: GTP-binding protein [Candidatus Methanomethylophilaceae archaeon]
MTEDEKTRVVMIAGLSGSGKTRLIRSLLDGIDTGRTGVIVNNEKSERELDGLCKVVDSFPIRTPCARPRQYRYRIEKMLDANDLGLIMTEPPGLCSETSAPVLNPIVMFKKDSVTVGPLITVMDYTTIPVKGINKDLTDEFKLFNLIFESDCIVVRKNEHLSEEQKKRVSSEIEKINPDACIVFHSDDEKGMESINKKVFSDEIYSRPLIY